MNCESLYQESFIFLLIIVLVNSIHTQVHSFDFDNMFISCLDVEDGLWADADGKDCPFVDCWGRTALHVAVTCKQKDVIKCFVNHAG